MDNVTFPIEVKITSFLDDIFGGEKYYYMPRYQRSYSWESKQVEDFWNDITFAVEQNSNLPYLLGSIYLAKVPSGDVGQHTNSRASSDPQSASLLNGSGETYFVIDGQQRITTFFLFLLALEDDAILSGLFSNGIPKLSLGNNDYDYFKALVSRSGAVLEKRTESNKRLQNTFDYFAARLKTSPLKSQLIRFLKEQLQIVKITVDNNYELTSTLFVSQTDRGKRLSNLEKLKGTIMFYSQKFEQSSRDLGAIDNLFGRIFENIETLCSMKLYAKPENAEGDILKIIHVFLMKDNFYRVFLNDLLPETDKDRKIDIWYEAGEDRIYEAVSRVFRETLSLEKNNVELLTAVFIKQITRVNDYYDFLIDYFKNERGGKIADLYSGKTWFPLKQLYSLLGLSVFSKALLVDLYRMSLSSPVSPFARECLIEKSAELKNVQLFNDVDGIKNVYQKLSAITIPGPPAMQPDIERVWQYPELRQFISGKYARTTDAIAQYKRYADSKTSVFNIIEECELAVWKNNKRPMGSFMWNDDSIEDAINHIKYNSFCYKRDYLLRDLSYSNFKYVLFEHERITQPYSLDELTRIFDYDIDADDNIDIQREHIFAQSPENYAEVKDIWLRTTHENYDDWIWQIGNIALLEHTINIGEASNKKIWDKAGCYLDSSFKGTQALAREILKLKEIIDAVKVPDDVAYLASKILIEIRTLELLAFTFYRFA